MSKSKHSHHDLGNYIMTISSINCGKCQKVTSDNIDWEEASYYFFRIGWRRTKKLTYCPKCSSKYLKQKV